MKIEDAIKEISNRLEIEEMFWGEGKMYVNFTEDSIEAHKQALAALRVMKWVKDKMRTNKDVDIQSLLIVIEDKYSDYLREKK